MAFSQHKSYLKTYLKSRRKDNDDGTDSQDKRAASHPKSAVKTKQKTHCNKQTDMKDREKSDSRTKAEVMRSTRGRVVDRKNKHCLRSGRPTIEWLPDELILEIFSYLNPQDLLTCGRVCKWWHELASDNLLWQTIYKKYATNVTKQKKPVKRSDNLSSTFWKRFCIQRGADYRNTRAQKIIKQKKINPFTGLPRGTQEAIQKSGLQWVLSFVDYDSQEHTVISQDVFFFNMAVCVRWYSFELPNLSRINRLRIYSGNPILFDEKGCAIQNSPLQRSVLYEVPFKFREIISKKNVIGSDNIISVYDLSDGLFMATWKDEDNLAFISMSFHADNLVQRCLHGTATRPWMPQPHKPYLDDIDRKYGLHSYTCTLELRNMRTSFWSQQFLNLHCLENFQDGYAVMQLIDPERSFERSWIEKKISLPWKTEVLKGIVKDVCLLDITLLDDQGKPIWCSCGLTKIRTAEETPPATYEYDGDYYTIIYKDKDLGKVVMLIIWEEASKKFYITSLQVQLSLKLINYWFGRKY